MNINEFIGAREEARKIAWKQSDSLLFARRFLASLIQTYIPSSNAPPVDPLKHELAHKLGNLARTLDEEMAAYLIGTTYTAMLPEDYRGRYGVFYTPPVLTTRLLDLAENAGVDWSTARIVDPACGGGAFLAPVVKRVVSTLGDMTAEDRMLHIETHVVGYEIDPFSAWISQVFVEAVLADEVAAVGRSVRPLVDVRDSLRTPESEYGIFDLVIGNPPYGKIKLESQQREYWTRSLYGHANLYGLFSDLACRLVSMNGVVAYVTPTSFLGGQYFKSLRMMLGNEFPPYAIDFVGTRDGVFADAQQETLLSVYRNRNRRNKVNVSYLSVKETGTLSVQSIGRYILPASPEKPWMLPRKPNMAELAQLCSKMHYRLSDLGYTVSTGPLVWNRHKQKLSNKKSSGVVPLIWAECVTAGDSGEFVFKTKGRTHYRWFKPSENDGCNLVHKSCVLVQRTTSMEQSRRLIAAELPQSFIDEYGGSVSVENHLNMVKPIQGIEPLVSVRVIAAILNNETVDQVFRCINGSTAVSAYELEAMPLPSPSELIRLQEMINKKVEKNVIDDAIREMYSDVYKQAAA